MTQYVIGFILVGIVIAVSIYLSFPRLFAATEEYQAIVDPPRQDLDIYEMQWPDLFVSCESMQDTPKTDPTSTTDIEDILNTKFKNKLNHKKTERSISKIILHQTGTEKACEAYDILKQNHYSTHYIIDQNGMIYHLIDDERTAFHALIANDYSIGIHLTHALGKTTFSDQQYAALKLLLTTISTEHSIPLNNDNVLGHFNVSTTKWDPSPDFEWEKINLPNHQISPINRIPGRFRGVLQ